MRAFFIYINIPTILADWADWLNKLDYIHNVFVVRIHEKARKQVNVLTYIKTQSRMKNSLQVYLLNSCQIAFVGLAQEPQYFIPLCKIFSKGQLISE